MSEERILTTEDVTITTLSIEVKVMKIGKRQVTLAVFRQLPDEPIIHPDTGNLKGIPWGRVNYHVDCEHMPTSHFHVVWQKDTELRRSLVVLPWKVEFNAISRKFSMLEARVDNLARGFIIARMLEGWRPETDRVPSRFTFHFQGRNLTAYLDSKEQNPWYVSTNGTPTMYTRDLEETLQRFDLPKDSQKINSLLLSALEEYEPLKQNWQQSYAQLEALDQLFIAV